MSWYTFRDRKGDSGQQKYFFDWFFSGVKGKILDVGCSSGNFMSVESAKVVGIDVDRDAIKKAKSKGLDVSYMDIQKGLDFKDAEFSGVYCSHVLEHLTEPLYALREMRRVLAPKGKLALMTPDVKMHGFSFWDLYDHVHPFTKKSLESIAYDAGFRKYEVYHTYIPIRGQGYLVKKGIINIKSVISLHRKLESFGIMGNNLVLEATK